MDDAGNRDGADGATRAQYEAYPYPARDPEDERRRLITGSPSWPTEMDHHLWGGQRDWSQPLRVLVAGGGTGDGLIQLARAMQSEGRPAVFTYLDLSGAARKIAEARARVRGLKDITFRTGSLMEAAEHGRFDYIDCCGVLHHLPDPQAGFDALAGALAPGGGIGLMVYAPYGRAGVYPLQAAFNAGFGHLAPAAKLAAARAVFDKVPEGHPLKRNPNLVDHREGGDAGFYDLLCHGSDRPYTITELRGAIAGAGLELAGMAVPALYDPWPMLPAGTALPDGVDQMALAENLRGTIKTHIAYARAPGGPALPRLSDPGAVPVLRGLPPAKLGRRVAERGSLRIETADGPVEIALPKAAGAILARIDGKTPIARLMAGMGGDPLAFNTAWAPAARHLAAWGLLHMSRFHVR